jgi:hypothetical protein
MKTIASLGIKELLRRAIQNHTLEHIDIEKISECQIILERVEKWRKALKGKKK